MSDNSILFSSQHFTHSDSLSFPFLAESEDILYYLRTSNGRTRLYSQNIQTGCSQALTCDPQPSASVTYGGRPYCVHKDGVVFFCANDKRLYRLDSKSGQSRSITPKFEGMGAPSVSACGKFVVFSAEDSGHCQIFMVDAEGHSYPRKLSFDPWYAINPVFGPSHVAWQEWERGSMPWQECAVVVLFFAEPFAPSNTLSELKIKDRMELAKGDVSYTHPQISGDGHTLAYLSDESGVRSLWLASLADLNKRHRVDLGVAEAGGPDWVVGLSQIQWSPDSKTVFSVCTEQAQDTLVRISTDTNKCSRISSSMTQIEGFSVGKKRLVLVGSSSVQAQSLVILDGSVETVKATSASLPMAESQLVKGEAVSWQAKAGHTLHGVLFAAKEKTAPTLINIHGGPTSQVRLGWQPESQYFASRGYHVFHVNYRGSTGYGRPYQTSLNGNWGQHDVADAKEAALYLVERGLADPERLVVMGGSAGGFTALLALIAQPDFWAAGISLYGICDLYELEKGSHRFEQNYTAMGVGELPQQSKNWLDRSAIYHAHHIKAPLLMFHGTDDKAVPWPQSQAIADRLKGLGRPCHLHLYEGEGHGFKKEKNRQHMLTTKEEFLHKYVACKQY